MCHAWFNIDFLTIVCGTEYSQELWCTCHINLGVKWILTTNILQLYFFYLHYGSWKSTNYKWIFILILFCNFFFLLILTKNQQNLSDKIVGKWKLVSSLCQTKVHLKDWMRFNEIQQCLILFLFLSFCI
jgi:hypothetical protein